MNRPDDSPKNSILIYTTEDGLTKIDTTFDGDTVWLSIDQMAELFQRDKSTISRHIKNIFAEGELERDSVVAKFATTAADGKTYQVEFYNLDVIISVGYRVKSKRGTQFRIWATGILKEYMRKGFALDDERLKNLAAVDISKSCWNVSVTSVLPKKCFIVRFWKSMQPALTTTQKQKSPSSSSKKFRIKFIMPSTVRLPPRSFTTVQMPKRNLWV